MADIKVEIEDAQPINVSLGEAVNVYQGGTNVYQGGTGDYNDLNNLPDLTLKADKSDTYTKIEVDTSLAGKAELVHVHTIADVTGLQGALDGKAPALGADDNYVTDAEKVVIGNTSGTNTGDQDLSGLLTTAAAPELIRDTMGTALVAGTNVTITPNDAGDTITIAATGGGSAFDAIKLMFQPTAVGNYIPPFAVAPVHGSMSISTSTFNSSIYLRTLRVVAWGDYTYDRVAFSVITPATDAGSVFAIGLYTQDGTFVKELGTVDATGAAGDKLITINETLAAGIHVLAIRFETPTTAGVNPTFYAVSGQLGEYNSWSVGSANVGNGPITSASSSQAAWPTALARTSPDIGAAASTVRMALRRAS